MAEVRLEVTKREVFEISPQGFLLSYIVGMIQHGVGVIKVQRLRSEAFVK